MLKTALCLRRTASATLIRSRGPGYSCFEGKATEDWIDHTVEVPFLADLTCEQWLRTFRAMNNNPANSASVRKKAREE